MRKRMFGRLGFGSAAGARKAAHAIAKESPVKRGLVAVYRT
jgi:hypothetical protein